MKHLLANVLADMPRCLTEHQVDQLVAHWRLVERWNERINLTAIAADVDAVWEHYRDSLAALPHIISGPVADMGSGAGFPGVPLAIARPEIQFTLVEPRRKRVSFLRTCVAQLQLENVRVLQARSADPPPELYAIVVTRATFSRQTDLEGCLAWVQPGGCLVAYRGGDVAPGAGVQRCAYSVRDSAHALHIWTRPAL